jgi:hypothetical protein
MIEGIKKAGEIEEEIYRFQEWKAKKKKFNPEDER